MESELSQIFVRVLGLHQRIVVFVDEIVAARQQKSQRRAPRHARWVGVLSYASATMTAYARMHDDRHWLSDVVVGAGVGSVTAAAIHRWHATRTADPVDGFFLRPVLAPRRDGAAVGFRATFR